MTNNYKCQTSPLLRKWLTALAVLTGFLFGGTSVFAQVDVTASGGTPTASYTTLKLAFDAINAGTHTGTISLGISANTTESAPAVLNASGAGSASYSTISIQPTGGAARTISGAIAAGSPLVDLNGADNVTIDGLNTGGNSLTFSNTTVSGTSNTSTIRFIGGATSNVITNTTILGAFSATVATNGGNIFFSTDAVTANGNDNNTISNCNIGPVGTNLSTKGVYLNGSTTTTALNNSGIIINNNNIFDYFGAAVASAGVYIAGGTTDINVTNNRFYQTATRTQTTGAQHSAVWITNTSGNNYQVTGNTIGYSSSVATGTYNFVGVSSSSVLIPIFLSVGTTTASNASSNTITAMAMSGAVSGTSSSAAFRGIYVSSGLATCNTNTIGSLTSAGAITFTSSSSSAGDVIGIFNFGSAAWVTNGNNVGGITANNTSTGAANIYGIRCNTSSTVTWTCNNNTVGGTIANSLNSTSTASGTVVNGILNSNPIGTFTGNVISNLKTVGGTGTGSTASISGILSTSTVAQVISGNTVNSLSATGASTVAGISVTGGTTIGISKNKIYDIQSSNASGSVFGISISGGATVTADNNIVGDLRTPLSNLANPLVGLNITGGTTVNAYYNTIVLNGTSSGALFGSSVVSASTTPTLTLRNNILVNLSSTTGAGLAVVYRRSTTTLTSYGSASNNNLMFTNSSYYTDGTNTDATFALYKARVSSRDNLSVNENPTFASTTGSSSTFLHFAPAASTLAESGALSISGFTTDFDGDTRNSSTPDIGADEGAFTAIQTTITSLSASPATGQCSAVAHTVTAVYSAPVNSSTLTFAFNGTSQSPVTMTNTSGNTWTGVIPAATPANANVTWSVSGTDGVYTPILAGTAYKDAYLTGVSTVAIAAPTTICEGTSSGLSVSAIAGTVGTTTLGTSTTTVSTTGNPYRAGFGSGSDVRTQVLVLASELTAANLSAGNITSLAMNSNSSSGVLSNFNISIAHTALTSLTTTYVTAGFTTVFTQASFTPVAGLNTHVFQTPFVWDGVSNIVINFCQTNSATTGTNVTQANSPGFNATLHTGGTGFCTTTTGTTFTTRPVLTLGGVIGTNYTSSLSWVWSPGGATTSSITVTPAVTTGYTATGTDANGCTVVSNTATINVNPKPSTPTGSGIIQCGVGIPKIKVSGGTAYNWYLVPTAGTPIQSSTADSLTSYSINSTTTFYVSSVNVSTSCESSRLPVTVTVNTPDSVAATASQSLTCPGTAITLTATQFGSVNSYVFTWNGPNLSATTGASVTATPTTSGTKSYTVTAVDTAAGCTYIASTSFQVTPPPVVNASASATTICAGTAVTLTATTNNFTNGTGNIGGAGTSSIGGNDGNPYRAGNGTGNQIRTQLLVLANEMTAAGFGPGSSLTSLAFTTTSSSTGTVSNFTIQLGLTNVSALNGTFQTSAVTTVFTQASLTPLGSGLNVHTFQTPFTWDGTSNILINTCQTNNISGTTTVVSSAPAFNANTHKAGTTTGCTDLTGTVVAQRPIIQFGGQLGTQGPGSLVWTWNPGSLSGNVVTVNPSVTTTYTVEGHDNASGCSTFVPVTINVNPLPVAPTATGSSQCGAGVPTASVSSNSGLSPAAFNWYTASSGGTPIQSSTATTLTSYIVSSTTTLYVSEINASTSCQSTPRTPVLVTVNQPDSVTINASPAPYCLGASVTLTAVNTGTTNNYSYSWNGSAGSGITNGTTGSSITFSPTTAGVKTITVTAADSLCTYIRTINITVGTIPVLTSTTATPSTVCAGSTVTLSSSSDVIGAGTKVIGAGASTSATYPCPFYSLWSNTHNQYLVLASELSAAGIYAGNITSLGVNISSAGTLPVIDLSVKIGHTTATNMSAYVSPAFTTVYTSASLMPVVGVNTMNFSTPFVWDGVSNIVIEVCHGNSGSSATMSRTGVVDNTSFVSTIHVHKSAASAAPATCSDLTTNLTTYSIRPQFTFNAQTIVTGPVYNYTWNPGALPGKTVTVNPVTTGTNTYTVTATEPASGCTVTATASVNILAIPATPVATNSTQCGYGVPTASVTGTAGSLRWYLASTGGTPLAGQTGTSLTGYNISTTTDFFVSTFNGTCESGRVQVTATVNQPDSVFVTSSANAICPGSSVTLTANQVGSTNPYTFTWNGSPAAGSGISGTVTGSSVTITPTVSGTYVYTVTAFDGTCTYIANKSVTLNPAPASINAGSDQSICSGSTATLNATSAGLIPTLRFSEVLWQVKAGTGASTTVPAFISSWYGSSTTMDMLEVTNMGAASTLAEGVTFEIWTGAAATAPVHSYTIPAGGATIQSGGLMYLSFSLTQVINDFANNFYTPGTNLDNGSGTSGGVIMRKNGVIIDAVGVSGYVFPAASGVTSADWSGTLASNSGLSGSVLIANDNNSASAWANTSSSQLATLGTLNSGLTPNLPSQGNVNWTSIPAGFTGTTASVTVGPLTSTTQYVAEFNNGQCSSFDTVQVNVFATPPPVIITQTEDTICISGQSKFTVTNPAAGVNYQWLTSGSATGPWTAVSGANSNVFVTPVITAVLSDSTVYYRVVGSCGTSQDSSGVYSILITNPRVVSSVNGTRCGLGTVQLSATGSAGTILNWYAASGGLPLGTGNTFTTPSISSTTTYYVGASLGGTSLNTAMPAALSTATSGAGTTAFGLVFDVYAPFTLTSVDVYPVSASNASGTVTIDIIDANNTVLNTATVNVTGSPVGSIAPVTIPLNFTVAPGTNLKMRPGFTGISGLLFEPSSAAPGGNYGYPYTVPGVFSILTSTLTAAPTNTARNDLYYYFYNWKVTTGCESGRVPVTATVTTPPAISVTASATTICAGQSVNLNVTSPNDPNYKYTWNGSLVGASQTVSPVVTTTYNVVALDTTSGPSATCGNSASVTITVNPLPTTPTITQNPTTVCGGIPVTLTATSLQSGVSTIGTGTGTNSTVGQTPFTGNYEGSKIQYLITAAELSAAGVLPGPFNALAFNVTTAATTVPMSAYNIKMGATSATSLSSYQTGLTSVYTAPGTVMPVAGWNTFTFNGSFTWNGTSNVVIEICHNNDPTGSCSQGSGVCWGGNSTVQSTTTSFNSVYGDNEDNTTPSNPWDLCSQTTTASPVAGTNRPNIRITFGAPNSFLWSNGATTAATTFTPPDGSSTYTVTATNSFGCTKSSSITVNASATPKPVVTPGDTTLCFPNEVYLHAIDTAAFAGGYPAGTTVDWVGIVSGLPATDSISSINSNSFQVIVTLPSGCQGTSSVRSIITRNVAVSSVTQAPACGSNNGKIVASVTSGTAPFHYIWKDGSNNVISSVTSNNPKDSIMNLAPGNYSLEVYDLYNVGNGCTSGILTYNLVTSLSVVLNTSSTPVSCNAASDGTATVSVTGGTGSLTYLWSNSSTSTAISGLAGGTYTVTVSDALGCSSTDSVVVFEPSAIAANFTLTNPTCASGTDGSITAQLSGGTQPYTFAGLFDSGDNLVGDSVASGLSAGNYYIIVVDNNSCVLNTNTTPVTLVNPAPIAISGFTPTSGAEGDTVVILGVSFTPVTAVSFNGTAATYVNVVDNNTIQTVVPVGATTGLISVTSICGTATSADTFTVIAPSFATVNVKAFIEGYYLGGGTMQPVFNNIDGVTATNLTDTIRVEFRDPFSPATAVNVQYVIMNTAGQATMQLPASMIGNAYYIAVFHRSSVETWSALPVTISSITTYDFTTSSSQAYDDGINLPMREVEPNVWALYSGDINQDGTVDASDMNFIDNDASTFSFGYNTSDVSGDGATDALDMNFVDNNSQLFLFTAHP